MLYRYANYKNDTTAEKFSVTDFQDKDEVSEFAQEAVAWAVDRQIITGDQGMINPKGDTLRAVCAAMVQRFLENCK